MEIAKSIGLALVIALTTCSIQLLTKILGRRAPARGSGLKGFIRKEDWFVYSDILASAAVAQMIFIFKRLGTGTPADIPTTLGIVGMLAIAGIIVPIVVAESIYLVNGEFNTGKMNLVWALNAVALAILVLTVLGGAGIG